MILGFHHVGLVDGDFLRQGGAFHGCAGQNGVQEFLIGGLCSLAGEDACAHGFVLAEVAGDGTGVYALDANDALFHQFVIEASLRAPVGGTACGVANDVACHPDSAGLSVFAVDAGVTDVRRSLDYQLARVGGVGDGLLVTGHAGGEHRFTERSSLRAIAAAAEHAAVFEHQHCC